MSAGMIDAASPLSAVRSGASAARAAYFAFMLWIPIETIYFFKDESNPGASGGVTISRLLGILLFGLALIDARRCLRRFPAAFWMVAWYLVAYAASQLWVPLELESRFRQEQMTMLQMAALFLISANLFEDSGFREAVFRFYGWWIGVVAAVLLLGAFPGAGGRSSIATQDPNVTAGFFALGAVCLAADRRMFARGVQVRLVVSLLAIAVLLLAILKTGSRGGLLVFATGILALGACGGRTTRIKRLSIAGAVAAALILMVVHEFTRGTATAMRLDAAWTGGDTAGRAAIWRTSWAMFLERPFFGYGGVNNAFTLGVHLNYPFRDAHNLFLAVLTEVGLIGAVPFFGALALALWRSWRHGSRTGDALPFALMAALLANNIPLTGLRQKLFWIVFAAAIACGAKRGASETAS